MSVYTHEIKREENAKILLTIHVPQNIVYETYQEDIKDVAKTAQIKGFRKGKVPINVLEQKFGESLRANVTEKVITEAIKSVLEHVKEQPLFYSQPQIKEDSYDDTHKFIIDPNKEYSFTITYDTEPQITLANKDQLLRTQFNISVDDKDIEKELKNIQERNAITSNKTNEIEHGDEVTYSYVELGEDNNEIPETKREDFTSTIGDGKNIYDLDDDILNMKQGEEKIVSKTYPEDYTYKEIAGKTARLKIIIDRVRVKELPPIDDELAQDVNEKYKTLDDLKKHLKKQLENKAEYLVSEQDKREIIDYFIANSTYEIPQSAIEYQKNISWQQLVRQYGGDEKILMQNLKISGITKELLMEQWQDDARKQVTEQFIIQELIGKEDKVSDDEVKQQIKEESEKTDNDYDEMLKYYTEHNLFEQYKYEITLKKVFDNLKKITTIKEEKHMTFSELLDYTNPQQEHTHHHEEEVHHE